MGIGIATRLKKISQLRYLDETEADSIMEAVADLHIMQPILWAENPGKTDEWRFNVAVFNALNENLTVTARVNQRRPFVSHWCLVWGDKRLGERAVNLRRLDLRDDHTNPDGEQDWVSKTHKHIWSSQYGERFAYTPDDIPHDCRLPPLVPDSLKCIFEAFARECGIRLIAPGYQWSEPPIGVPEEQQATLWEIP